MVRTHGWGRKGERVRGSAPFGHWRTMTFLAALRADRIDAPYVLDGPINGLTFPPWVEQCLVPTLRPGDVVVVDNLGSHKGKAVRRRSGRLRPPAVPAALQPGPEPDRAGLRRAQDPASKGAEPRSVEAVWRKASARFSTASAQPNAPTTSGTADMPQPKLKTL